MTGVYLVAAELTRRGFIVSVTSRSARGADILATDKKCQRAYSVQVKTNSGYANYWLVGKRSEQTASKSYIYIFVNLDKPIKEKKFDEEEPEYFIVPSRVVKIKTEISRHKASTWYSFSRDNAKSYKNWFKPFGGKS